MNLLLDTSLMPFLKLDATSVLGAMLAPALLITGTAGLLTSANARLIRVVDRLRALLKEYDHAREDKTYKGELIVLHRKRSRMILQAIAFLYLSLAFYVGASLSLAFNVLGHEKLSIVPIIFSILGVSMMLLGCLMMWREVRLAIGSFENEIDHEIKTTSRKAQD